MKMKLAVVCFALLVAAATCSEDPYREKRWLLRKCSTEADCGKERCCLLGKYCSPKLPKYSTCFLTSHTKCGCSSGLACRITKELTILGVKVQLRQCMEATRNIAVEKLSDEALTAPSREKRFLIDKCSTESDCGENRCCLFNKFCAKKIPEDSTCYLSHVHKCGCADGLECKVTTTIKLPITGTQIPIRQCVKPKA